ADVGSTAQKDPSAPGVGRSITLLDMYAASPAAGNDSIAGGAGNDSIFGQFGDDGSQGDASAAPPASRTTPSVESATDGNDYIEGNAGNDVIYGDGGQDDIVGGSSNLFGATTAAARPDGTDLIFGGAGLRTARNDAGDTSANGHAADADAIA